MDEEQINPVEYVKSCIVDYKEETFDIIKIQNCQIDKKTAKGILDPIYKTVKGRKSNSTQKNIALKMLKKIIIKTKNTTFINLFLICQMWDFFCQQFREYKRNDEKSPSIIYNETYYMLLEDMLQSFNYELGIDNKNKETPFSKFWKAVHKKDINKNVYITRMCLEISNLKEGDENSLGVVKDKFGNYKESQECKYFIRQFLGDFEKKSKTLEGFKTNEKMDFRQLFEFKREFFKFCEKEYFYGHIENETYDLFENIVKLEEEKYKMKYEEDEYLKSFVKLQRKDIKSSNNFEREKKVEFEKKENQKPKNFQDLDIPEILAPKSFHNRTPRSQIPKENPDSKIIDSFQNKKIERLKISELSIKSKNSLKIFDNIPLEMKSKQNSLLEPDINLEREMSRINQYRDSQKYDTHSSKNSYKKVLELLDKTSKIDPKRIEIQKNLKEEDLKRLKAFAFLKKAKIFSNNFFKIGIESVFFKRKNDSNYKEVRVTCFWESLYGDIRNVVVNIKHEKKNFAVKKTSNSIFFILLNFEEFLDYPFLDISFKAEGNTFRKRIKLLFPINKFIFIPRQDFSDHERFLKKDGYKMIKTDSYPLDVNFFKSKKEIKYVFRNFRDISATEIGGVFELQYVKEFCYMKIHLLKQYNFFVEVKIVNIHVESIVRLFLQEVVMLLGDFSDNNSFNN